MKARFRKNKGQYDFKRDLNTYFFKVLLVTGLLINVILFQFYSLREREVVMDGKRWMMYQTISYTDQIMKEINTIGETIWTSTQVQKLKMVNPQDMDYLAYLNCMNYLSTTKLSVNSIYRIRVFNSNTATLITSDKGVFYSLEQPDIDYYNNQINNISDAAWAMDFNSDLSENDSSTKKVITYTRPIYSITTGRKFGLLCIDVPIEVFHDLINHYNNNEEGFTILQGNNIVASQFNDDGIINMWQDNSFLLTKASKMQSGNLKFKYNGRHYVCLYETSKNSGWKFYTYYHYSYLFANQFPALIIGVLFILILFLAYQILIRVSEKKVTHPIEILLDAMKKFEQGDFGVQITETRTRKDIFDVIFQCFNHMSSSSKELVEDLILERLRIKDGKLRMLQSQIKPHFLYNIFNNMIWMSEQKNYTGLEQMIYATAGYYKTSLNFGQQLICVADNLKQLKYYAQIQEVRFPNSFTCEILFDDILSACIPNLMLQPLLENAINHGAAQKEGITQIKIHGYRRNDELYFEVWDNGVGIPKQRLEEIRNAINDEGYNGSDYFALVNIAERLRMYYQGKGQITIDSECGSWTSVTLKLLEDETICIN